MEPAEDLTKLLQQPNLVGLDLMRVLRTIVAEMDQMKATYNRHSHSAYGDEEPREFM